MRVSVRQQPAHKRHVQFDLIIFLPTVVEYNPMSTAKRLCANHPVADSDASQNKTRFHSPLFFPSSLTPLLSVNDVPRSNLNRTRSFYIQFLVSFSTLTHFFTLSGLPVPQVQKRPRTRFTSRLCSYRPIRYSFGLSTSRYRAVHVIPFFLSRKDIGINSSILLALSCSVSSSLSSSFILPPNPTFPP